MHPDNPDAASPAGPVARGPDEPDTTSPMGTNRSALVLDPSRPTADDPPAPGRDRRRCEAKTKGGAACTQIASYVILPDGAGAWRCRHHRGATPGARELPVQHIRSFADAEKLVAWAMIEASAGRLAAPIGATIKGLSQEYRMTRETNSEIQFLVAWQKLSRGLVHELHEVWREIDPVVRERLLACITPFKALVHEAHESHWFTADPPKKTKPVDPWASVPSPLDTDAEPSPDDDEP